MTRIHSKGTLNYILSSHSLLTSRRNTEMSKPSHDTNSKQSSALFKMFQDQQTQQYKKSTDTCYSLKGNDDYPSRDSQKYKKKSFDLFGEQERDAISRNKSSKLVKKSSYYISSVQAEKQANLTSLQLNRRASTDCRRRVRKDIKTLRFGNKWITVLRKLGAGKYGSVFLVIENTSGMTMAMKVIQKSKIESQKILQQLISELKIQAFLSHPNIVTMYGFFQDQQNVYILMQLGSEGQLYTFMQKQCMSQESTSFIIQSLLSAVDCLHDNNIIHRDIKPENVVVTHGTVKLCDFGWAVHLKKELRSTYCGTPLYFSPEILTGKKYDEKVDIWAIGVLTYELLTGSSPFGITREKHLYKIVTNEVQFPQDGTVKMSTEFKAFVKNILRRNPRDRCSCHQLLKMRFIRKYQDFETCEQLCK